MHTISIYPKMCLDREGIHTWKNGREYTEEGTRWTMKTTESQVDGFSYSVQVQYDGATFQVHYFGFRHGKISEFVSSEEWEQYIQDAEDHGVYGHQPSQDPWQAGISMGFKMGIFEELEKKFRALVEIFDLSYCD